MYCMKLIFVLSGRHILDAYVLQKKNLRASALGIVYVTIIGLNKQQQCLSTDVSPRAEVLP